MTKKKKSKKALLLLLLLLGGVGAVAVLGGADKPVEAAKIDDVNVSIKIR